LNVFDDTEVDRKSFAYRDLLSQDLWESFTPSFGSLTVVGTPTYLGRYRRVGMSIDFQVKFSATTSVASVAGTDYLTLPIAAKGYSGVATMTNDTTNIAVGLCHIDAATSRCYLPTQNATSSVLNLAGRYEG
jgi:hypothetical protein